LQIADGSLKITAVEINSPERVLGASVTWVLGDDGLCELVGFLDIACAKTRHRKSTTMSASSGASFAASSNSRVACQIGTPRQKYSRAGGDQSDHLVVVTFGF